MPSLPDNCHPFRQTTVYDDFGIDPFASDEEISTRLDAISESFANLSDKEKQEKLQKLQEGAKQLTDRKQRIQLNALIPETLDVKTIVERLKTLSTQDINSIRLPEVDLRQVVSEADAEEVARADFTDVPSLPDLELDFGEVDRILSQTIKDSEPYFDS